MIDYSKQPPEDFPKLAERIFETDFIDLQDRCGGNIIFAPVFQCTIIDFCTNTAWYVVMNGSVPLEHETAHAKGYDHYPTTNPDGTIYGGSEIRDLWAYVKTLSAEEKRAICERS